MGLGAHRAIYENPAHSLACFLTRRWQGSLENRPWPTARCGIPKTSGLYGRDASSAP